MFARGQNINRRYYGKDIPNFMELPNLIDIQIQSYNKFLNDDNDRKDKDGANAEGLESVFRSTFPIESINEDMSLQYLSYSLDYESIKFSEIECKQKGLTYSVPLKAEIDLFFKETKEIRRKSIYMGDIPLMTDRGTFIINGAERVVVSQIHRSPGVIFSYEKGVYSSRIIPYRGTWLEFEIDQKRELIYAKLDSKKRILGTIFLRALGYDTREKIIDLFYKTKTAKISSDRSEYEELIGQVLARDVFINGDDGEKRKIYQAGEKIHPHNIDDLIQNDIKTITVIDFEDQDSLNSQIIFNCFEREEIKYTPDPTVHDEPTVEDALSAVYNVIRPGDPITVENAKEDLHNMFFTARRYDIGKVGRYKLNKKFDYGAEITGTTLIEDDIFKTMKFLIKVYIGEENVDDIDHLGNRRIRSVGEIMTDVLKKAFSRMERIARDRMSSKEMDTIKPQDLISIKPIVAAIKEFSGLASCPSLWIRLIRLPS